MVIDRRELLIGLGSSATLMAMPWDRAKAATDMELFAAARRDDRGSYSAALTAGTTPGQAVVTGELGGEAIGGNVTVTLEAQCVVPHVRGKTLGAAKNALRRAHCGVGAIKTVRSATLATDKVISQSPVAGRVLAPGTKVKLTVSRGRR